MSATCSAIPLQGELARRLVRQAGPGRVFFCNSGAEANEALIKLARLHGRKKAGGEEGRCFKILCAKQAFHGRTFGGMSATPQEKIQGGFRPLVPGFAFGELNRLETFASQIDAGTAAIFVETIQGEGGVNPCTPEFLRGLRQLCDQHDLLLMLDEVQCGVGRTGRFYAYEHAGIAPDAIGMAKGLGGGVPIGAMWVRERFAELFQPGSHGTTFGGTPLACAAALAVLDVIERDGLLDAGADAERSVARGAAPAGGGVSGTRLRRARPGLPRRAAADPRTGTTRGRAARTRAPGALGRGQRRPAAAAAHRDGGRAGGPSRSCARRWPRWLEAARFSSFAAFSAL
jgi:acetylornithine/succinyldiaminopimelate/putrescine aminotransferase